MSGEFSDEMRQELLSELYNDCQRMAQLVQYTDTPAVKFGALPNRLEQLVYITEQMRLKLKMLGAPRIYN